MKNVPLIAPQHAKEAVFFGRVIGFRLYYCGPIWPFGAYTDWAGQLAVGLNLHLVSPFSSEVVVYVLCPVSISATSDRQETDPHSCPFWQKSFQWGRSKHKGWTRLALL